MNHTAATDPVIPGKSGPKFFGIPFGDFGLFATLLLSLSLGFLAFFAVTFVSIFGILIFNGVTHHTVDLSSSYKFIALPAGAFVLILSLFVLGGAWLRRRLTGR